MDAICSTTALVCVRLVWSTVWVSVVNRRCSVTGELKDTGQRLFTKHACVYLGLVPIHTHTRTHHCVVTGRALGTLMVSDHGSQENDNDVICSATKTSSPRRPTNGMITQKIGGCSRHQRTNVFSRRLS